MTTKSTPNAPTVTVRAASLGAVLRLLDAAYDGGAFAVDDLDPRTIDNVNEVRDALLEVAPEYLDGRPADPTR
ncbi:MAG TPA: hypothetical protein VIA11_15630 [Acidimicrobiia bacterium]|nr:hypothetical protein [Acidimicrobiia bacterium]